ncbi:Ribosome-binding factor A [Piscirickettsia salmonis]|uniref:30S ribosome-binding factor RbfA n=1 Tax=Piscirickettsia salmonis TaxID=1238 RepID=UPI0012BAC7BA|nr:30S ribosome-binding factor RbfA [Piscirickettsia salmonis]QGP52963.1 Ribosome-binding factor A [Piscirickettsia salmonis]QGP61106.1 Ribosome-binding factor A [Piscirickettsia salmonis]QGP62535.1 Ribosome-binding factor A [Piscirickettsia salmonis]
MKEYSRTQRIADQMQKELAELLQQEMKDPRIGMITVSGVDVSKDLAHAKVYVTMMEEAEAREEALVVLQKAAGFLRSMLAKRMNLRATPKLRFEYDGSTEQGNALSALINKALYDKS